MTAKVVAFTPNPTRSPTLESGKVPRKPKNAEVRTREYLTPEEVDILRSAAKGIGRHGHRDATLILLAYRHGLRVSELVSLRWDQIDLKAGVLHVVRRKNGRPSTHPLRGPVIRALRRLARNYPDSPYVFCSERRGPLTTSGVRKIVA
jgi:type 1 fimbriae regulatory protein FimE